MCVLIIWGEETEFKEVLRKQDIKDSEMKETINAVRRESTLKENWRQKKGGDRNAIIQMQGHRNER